MGALYLGALIVGLGILLLQIVMSSGKDFDAADHSFDVAHADMDVDLHVDGDADADHGDAHGHDVGGIAALFLSFRFWTFALAAFGMLGTGLHYTNAASPIVTLVAAVTLGLLSGLGASWLFRVLRTSSVNSGADVKELVGQVGKVLVPPNSSGRAKVRLIVKGQMIDYVATTDDAQLSPGASVLVEEVRNNQVHVSAAPAGLSYSDE